MAYLTATVNLAMGSPLAGVVCAAGLGSLAGVTAADTMMFTLTTPLGAPSGHVSMEDLLPPLRAGFQGQYIPNARPRSLSVAMIFKSPNTSLTARLWASCRVGGLAAVPVMILPNTSNTVVTPASYTAVEGQTVIGNVDVGIAYPADCRLLRILLFLSPILVLPTNTGVEFRLALSDSNPVNTAEIDPPRSGL